MRVTVTIDDDVLAAAQVLADQSGRSLGSALSVLARRGFEGASTAGGDGDPTVFAVPIDAEPVTSEDVYRSLDEWP
ncbi:MAG: antitoxin [Chloroflexi bacterium]|nr:antitoxin [Chloroflexota bacterium]